MSNEALLSPVAIPETMEVFAAQLVEKFGFPETSSVLLKDNTLQISVPTEACSLVQEKIEALISYTASLGPDIDLEIWVGSNRFCLLSSYAIAVYQQF